MFTASIAINVGGQVGASYSSSSSIEAGLRKSLFEAIPESATTVLTFGLDVSATKMLLIRSDKDLVIKVNDDTAPSNTFNLTAEESFIWPIGAGVLKDSLGANITADFVSLHVENSSAESATLRLDALLDPTP